MVAYLILMSAIADRIRGDAFQPWKFESNHRIGAYILLGWTFSALTGHVWDMLTFPIALLLVAGASFGLSEPIGAYLTNRTMNQEHYEWWQFSWLKTSPLLALTFRGAMWGLPVSLLYYFDPMLIWTLPAYAIAMPVSAIVSKYVFSSDWEKMEFVRGGLAAGIYMLCVSVYS